MSVGFHPSTRTTRSGDRTKLKDTMRSPNPTSTSNSYITASSFRLLRIAKLLFLRVEIHTYRILTRFAESFYLTGEALISLR